MPPTVLITRPEAAAQRLADQIRKRWGAKAPIVISPVMEIIQNETALDLADIKTLIFTSRHGVNAFARLSAVRDLPCYVVGKITAAEAEKQGLSVVKTAEDADALVSVMVRDRPCGPCLHLHGEHSIGDIAGLLNAADVTTREQIVYRQRKKSLSSEAQELLARSQSVILPLYSPRSAALFFEGGPYHASLFVAAISQNAAARVPEKEVEMLIVAERPEASAMFQAMDQLRQNAIRLEGAKRAQ